MATRQYDFIVGPETSTQPTVGTPSASTDLINKGYADIHYMQGRLSCADVTAIKAVAAADRTNGDIVLNRATDKLYRFNSSSTATGDDYNVLTPSAGSGRWILIGSASSSTGEVNCCTSPSDAANWVASGAGVTVATSTTAADLPLEGIISSCLKITGVSGTDYARFRFTMPDALLSRKLKIEWFQLTAGGYATGDFKVDLYYNAASNYSGAYTRVALSTDVSAVSSIPALTGKYTTTFDDVATNLYYELRIVRTAGTGNLNIANLVIGPGIQPQGAVVGPWLSYTPTFTGFGTPTNISFFYRQNGNTYDIRGFFTAGTVSATDGTMTLPNGYSIDTSFIAGDKKSNLGYYSRLASATTALATADYTGVMTYESSLGATVLAFVSKGTSNAYAGNNASSIFSNSEGVAVNIIGLPISELSGSGVLNVVKNDVEYVSNSSSTDAADTTSFVYGPSGSTGVIATTALSAARAKRVQFLSPIQSTDTIILEYQPGGGTNPWIELTGIDTGADLGNYHVQNGESYGIKITRVSGSNTQLDIIFGHYAWPNSTYGAAGVAWNTSLASTRWRVKKFTGGQAVGFANANSSQTGLVNTSAQTFGGRKNAGNSKVVVTRSGAQSISTGTTTKIQFDTEEVDTNGEYDPATNYRFTATNSGYYLAILVVEMSSIGDGKAMQVYLRKNNSTVGQFYSDMKVGNTGGIVMQATGIFSLNGTTDYIEAFCEQNSGGSTNVSGGTSATRLVITELI